MAPSSPPPLHPVLHALRIAFATVCTLFVCALLDLPFANVAVYCTHMTMVQFPVTIFQRGLERLLGRAAGIGLGLLLATVFVNHPVACLAVEGVAVWFFFYLYQSGHLAYTFFNAGLFVGVLVEIGHAEPAAATDAAAGMLVALTVGVAVALLVAWLTGADRGLRIDPGGLALWPLRRDWASKALLITVSTVLTQLAGRALDLGSEASMVAVMVLLMAPGVSGLVHKAELRLLGAALGSGWSLLTFAALAASPRLVLLAGMMGLGMYLAVYLARSSPAYSYAGVQMGLVIPMLSVAAPGHFGDISAGLTRIFAVFVGTFVGVVVAGLWPRGVEKAPA